MPTSTTAMETLSEMDSGCKFWNAVFTSWDSICFSWLELWNENNKQEKGLQISLW